MAGAAVERAEVDMLAVDSNRGTDQPAPTAVHTLFDDAEWLLDVVALGAEEAAALESRIRPVCADELRRTVVVPVPESQGARLSRAAVEAASTSSELVHAACEALTLAGQQRSLLAHGWTSGLGGPGGRALQQQPNKAADYLTSHRGWAALVRVTAPGSVDGASGARLVGAAVSAPSGPAPRGARSAAAAGRSASEGMSSSSSSTRAAATARLRLAGLLWGAWMVFVPAGEHGCYLQVAGTPFSVVAFGRRAAAIRDRRSRLATSCLASAVRRWRGREARRGRANCGGGPGAATPDRGSRKRERPGMATSTSPPTLAPPAKRAALEAPSGSAGAAHSPPSLPATAATLEGSPPDRGQPPPPPRARGSAAPVALGAVLARAEAAARDRFPPVAMRSLLHTVVHRAALAMPPSCAVARAARRVQLAARTSPAAQRRAALCQGAALAASAAFGAALLTGRQSRAVGRALRLGPREARAALPPRLREASRLLSVLLLRLCRLRVGRLVREVCPTPAAGEQGPRALSVPTRCVQTFLCRAVRAVVPRELMGGPEGARPLLRLVAAIPALPRSGEQRGEWVFRGVPAASFRWAGPPGLRAPRAGAWPASLDALLAGNASPSSSAAPSSPVAAPASSSAGPDTAPAPPAAAAASSSSSSSSPFPDSGSKARRGSGRRPLCDPLQARLCRITCRFIVHEVALPLVLGSFHASEMEGEAGKPVAFFRRRHWRLLERRGFAATARRLALVRERGPALAAAAAATPEAPASTLHSSSSQRLSPSPSLPVAGGLALRSLGFGPMRLVPKARGMRPVVNLSLAMGRQAAARAQVGAAPLPPRGAAGGSAGSEAAGRSGGGPSRACDVLATASAAGLAAVVRPSASARDVAAEVVRRHSDECWSLRSAGGPVRQQARQTSFADASVNSKLITARNALASAVKATPAGGGAAVDMLSATSLHRAMRCFRAVCKAAGLTAVTAPERSATHGHDTSDAGGGGTEAGGAAAGGPAWFAAASADVRACYDTIPHNTLARIVPALFASSLGGEGASSAQQGAGGCVLRTVAMCRREQAVLRPDVHASASRPPGSTARDDGTRLAGPISFFRHASHRLDWPGLAVSVAAAGPSLRHTVLCESVAPRCFSPDDVAMLLRAHVEKSQMVFRGRVWRQRRGIPQGSTVSALLCTAHYASVDASIVAPAALHGASRGRGAAGPGSVTPVLVVRLMDDFLVLQAPTGRAAEEDGERVTEGEGGATHEAVAGAGSGAMESVLSVLEGGSAEFGCAVNPSKTKRSYPHGGTPKTEPSDTAGRAGAHPAATCGPGRQRSDVTAAWTPEACGAWFEWCGLRLGLHEGPASLGCRLDWTRLRGSGDNGAARGVGPFLVSRVLDAQTPSPGDLERSPTDAVVSAARASAKRRALTLLFDRECQPAHVAVVNVAEAAAVAAGRCLALFQRLASSSPAGAQLVDASSIVSALSRVATAVASIARNATDRRGGPTGGDGGAAARSTVRRGAVGGAIVVMGGDGLTAWAARDARATTVTGQDGSESASLSSGDVRVAPLLAGDPVAPGGGASDDDDDDSDEFGDCDSVPPSPGPGKGEFVRHAPHWSRGRRSAASAIAVQLSRDARFGDGLPLPWLEFLPDELRLAALMGVEAVVTRAGGRGGAGGRAAGRPGGLRRAAEAAAKRVAAMRGQLEAALTATAGPRGPPPPRDTAGVPLPPGQRLACLLCAADAARMVAAHVIAGSP